MTDTSPQPAHSPPPPTAAAHWFWNMIAIALPVAVMLYVLRDALSSLDTGIWGPASPWSNGDFIGNFWCWWRTAERWSTSVEWMDTLGWPEGGDLLWMSFPNRLDAWLVAPLFRPDDLVVWWNAQAILHLMASVVALVVATRFAGASALSAASASSLLIFSPTLFHELAGGRMATFIFWPGILLLGTSVRALKATSRQACAAWAMTSGALLALQVYAYAYHAVAAVLLLVFPLLLHSQQWRQKLFATCVLLATTLILAGPYALRLLSLSATWGQLPPPAGYTSLPLAGALGLGVVPERFQMYGVVAPVILAALLHRTSRPWSLAAALGLLMAAGPLPRWDLNHTPWPNPILGLLNATPALARMHHPVRAAPLALAAASVSLAILLDAIWRSPHRRLHSLYAAITAGLWAGGWTMARPMQAATSWAIPSLPPGINAALHLRAHGEGPIIDVFGGRHITGLSLQPWHHRPLLETAQGYQPPPTHTWADSTRKLVDGTLMLTRGEDPGAVWFQQVRVAGFSALLLVERPTRENAHAALQDATRIIQAQCGAPVYVDPESRIFSTATCVGVPVESQPVMMPSDQLPLQDGDGRGDIPAPSR